MDVPSSPLSTPAGPTARHLGRTIPAQEELALATGELAGLDVRPWEKGWSFYTGADGARNILGVVITIILVAFGAPLWFQRLKELANLRDALKPKPSAQ